MFIYLTQQNTISVCNPTAFSMYGVFLSTKPVLGTVDCSFRSVCAKVTPSRRGRCGSAGAEYVTAIAHVIVTHEQLTGKRHKNYQKKNLFLVVF